MAPRVSVVVPIHNVALYLETCLESLAQQTMGDLEIVMVDDGSTDESPVIAQRFVTRDGRFRLVRQANAGQGAARNTGLGYATGEFFTFVDGDDVVPRHAYEVLSGVLDQTGSDFASGNVRRLSSLGTSRAVFLANAFEHDRRETHITRFPDLIVDRLACNKLFRKSFWEREGLSFPEGVRNEDIRLVLPAHYLAGSVDVVSATVYLWRRRESGELSGSQRRTGPRALRHRVAAVDHVSRFLADREMTEAKYLYDRSVVGNDLRYFLNLLDAADDDYRHLFLDLVNDFLDRADPRVLEQPLAIDRLKWHLVRRRALPELLTALRFAVEDLSGSRPIRRLGAWYGDYPYRTDRQLRIPSSVYRLDGELPVVSRLNDVRWEGDTLRIEGYAYIDRIGAPRRRSQSIEVLARRPRSGKRRLRLRTERVHRPDVTADAPQELVSLDWSGFVATLETAQLRRGDRWRKGRWRIGLVVRAGGVVRESWRARPAPLHAVPAAERSFDGWRVRAGLTPSGQLELRIQQSPSLVRTYVLDQDAIELEGDLGAGAPDNPTLILRRRDGSATLDYSLHADRTDDRRTFRVRIPIGDLIRELEVADRAAHTEERADGIAWDVYLAGGGRRRRLALHADTTESAWAVGDREIAVQRTRLGNLTIVERAFRPLVTRAEWSPAGALELSGSFHGPPGEYEFVIRSRRGGEAHTVPLRYDVEAGRFAAVFTPGGLDSLAGTRPLSEGGWDLFVRPQGNVRSIPVKAVLEHELLDGLPISATIDRKPFRFGALGHDFPLIEVQRDLEDDERGGFRQRQLRTTFYRARRERNLRDVVLFDCFGGREYSDSPRSIHEELVRRGVPLEHLWVVRDGACAVPPSALAVRELSKDYYEAYASARYVVSNDHWPRWVARRPDQTWLQTWHGAPLKQLGHDLARRPKAVREYRRALTQAAENWQFVISPGSFATPILHGAFPATARVLETGLPRTDVLLQPDADRLAEEVKRRLGLPQHKQVVLYAPTYRDHLGARDGYRLGPLPDLAALRSALGEDYAVLFRKHRLVTGALPPEAEGVIDVSSFPDATELLLAVDVLVTDYSSAIFDFAVTNRPMVFFTPDLEVYRDETRGFSIDFEADAPGPLLRSTEDVIAALRDPDSVRAAFGERYRSFVAAYCELSDGQASTRVVDQVFGT